MYESFGTQEFEGKGAMALTHCNGGIEQTTAYTEEHPLVRLLAHLIGEEGASEWRGE